jgi:hypothetical protein
VRLNRFVPADPPKDVAEVLLARAGRWHLPVVRGIISSPTLRPDGSLIAEPGLDTASGWYLALPTDFRLPHISDRPDRSDATAALNLLDGLLADFPFIDDGGISRSVALSGLMTPLLRPAMPVAPMHGMTAPGIGSGKSFLVDLCAAVATGRSCPVIFLGASDEEFDKKLTGLLLGGVPLFSVDNARRPLETDLLCQAVERPLLELRRLGKSDTFATPNSAAVFATGNNLRVAGEMVRRALLASMDAGIERPELRQFHGNPVAAVLADRGRFVAAVLTIVRGYLAAGRPAASTPLASFDEWSRLVREPLLWLGRSDPVAALEQVREADPVLADLRAVLAGWEREIGLLEERTALQVVQLATETPIYNPNETTVAYHARKQAHAEFHDALLGVAGERGQINTRRLGTWLSKHKGRVLDDRRLVSPGATGGVARWKLEVLKP